MKFVKTVDSWPWWVKLLLALPVVGIFWAVYRIVKGAAQHKMSVLVAGIIWLVLGWAVLWIIDIISIIMYKDIKLFA